MTPGRIIVPPKDSRRWVSHAVVAKLERVPLLLPTLKALFHAHNRLRFGSTVRRNALLAGIEAQRPVALLGTGLSLLTIDVANLRGLALFGCNEVYKHPDFDRVHLDYYTAPVPYFGRLFGAAYEADFRQFLSEIDDAFRGRGTRLFLNASWSPFLRRHGLLASNATSFFLSERDMAEAGDGTSDLSTPVFSFGAGALSFMIAASVFMGARQIYLLGCGYTYSPRMHSHFFDALRLPADTPNAEVETAVHRFAALYPGYDVSRVAVEARTITYSVTGAFDEADATAALYRSLRRFADQRGVRIVNVVPSGFASPVFEALPTAEFVRRFSSPGPAA